MYPVECALDVGQALCDRRVFRQHAKTYALHDTLEFMIGVLHQINIDRRTEMDFLQLGFTVVGNDIPLGRVDQGE